MQSSIVSSPSAPSWALSHDDAGSVSGLRLIGEPANTASEIRSMPESARSDTAPHVIQVIETELEKRGDGDKTPIRRVRQYYTLEGNLLAEFDPFDETHRDLVELVHKLRQDVDEKASEIARCREEIGQLARERNDGEAITGQFYRELKRYRRKFGKLPPPRSAKKGKAK